MLRAVVAAALSLLAVVPVPIRAGVSVHNDGDREHVQITAGQAFSVAGWTLVSVKGDQKLRLPDIRLPSGAGLRIVSGATVPAAGDVVWTRRNVWNNDGDTALLLDANGIVVAEHTYGVISARGTSPAKAASSKGTKSKR